MRLLLLAEKGHGAFRVLWLNVKVEVKSVEQGHGVSPGEVWRAVVL